MKNILPLLFVITLLSCQNETDSSYVIFRGQLLNNTANTLKISGNNFEKEVFITTNGVFSDTLFVQNNGYYSLRIGRESTPIYLMKGTSLNLTTDIEQFDEKLKYSGEIASENNYLAAKYLLSENEMTFDKVYSLPQKKFIAEINKLNDSYSNLLNSIPGISNEFKSKELKELEYAHINNIENYESYHQYLTKNPTFKADETLYKDYKKFNFNDTEAFKTSNAYKRLLESHYQRIAQNESTLHAKDLTLVYLETIDTSFPDGPVKDELMFNYLRYGMKANAALEEVYKRYQSSNQNSENLSKVTSSYKVLSNLKPGKASPTFTYEKL